jgi:hypothetical protein
MDIAIDLVGYKVAGTEFGLMNEDGYIPGYGPITTTGRKCKFQPEIPLFLRFFP